MKYVMCPDCKKRMKKVANVHRVINGKLIGEYWQCSKCGNTEYHIRSNNS